MSDLALIGNSIMDQLGAMRAFARVVEVGSFTRAADLLDMPKATLTKLVQGLEAHLRTQLLHRTTRRVNVTPDGAAYYERAMRLLADLEELDGSMTQSQTSPSGRLRVDVSAAVARLCIVPALHEISQALSRHPYRSRRDRPAGGPDRRECRLRHTRGTIDDSVADRPPDRRTGIRHLRVAGLYRATRRTAPPAAISRRRISSSAISARGRDGHIRSPSACAENGLSFPAAR